MTPPGVAQSTARRWWLLALVLMAAVVAAGLAAFTVKYVSRPRPVEIALVPAESASPIEVYLGGAAGQEGIFSVDSDATLGEVLRRAGISLDAEGRLRISVSVLGAGDAAPAGGPGEGQSGKINVNTAGASELESLPGIGPARAQAIIDYRSRSGPFRTIDDLLDVPGIGAGTLEDIRDLVTIIG